MMESTVARPEGVKHSLHILLKSLIDYAGLFPPAGLDMAHAVANYARYRTYPQSWALGRFIIPAARLPEFEQHFVPDRTPWHLSALIGSNVADELLQVAEFNARHQHEAVVDTLEAKASSAKEIAEFRQQTPDGLLLYFEIPVSDDPKPLVDAIQAARSRAKVRTGGLTPEMFPAATHIVRFLETCISASVAFKATAGLHHPVRCTKALTYEKDSPVGTMHGFLNVFLASALLLDSVRSNEVESLLADDDASNFEFGDSSITWRGHRATQSRLLESRVLASSFGSCSFEEPIEDLRTLNLL